MKTNIFHQKEKAGIVSVVAHYLTLEVKADLVHPPDVVGLDGLAASPWPGRLSGRLASSVCPAPH